MTFLIKEEVLKRYVEDAKSPTIDKNPYVLGKLNTIHLTNL